MTVQDLKCPKCGTGGPATQTATGAEKKGCLRQVLEFLLIFIPVIGWGLLIWFLITDFMGYFRCSCQSCGEVWFITTKEGRQYKL